ncbi:hypothetical protein [Endozoicomonas sp.]|uniref:hypothetical protein n=1 Tax=Endozoicomonas sp. TaxID=1892382 RepID=UPI0028859245|nr:hypothetical protein [Endozoicomonas sp.]
MLNKTLTATIQNIAMPAKGPNITANITHSPYTAASNGRRVGHYDYDASRIPHHEQGRSKGKKALANHHVQMDKFQTKSRLKGKGKTSGMERDKAHISKAEAAGHRMGATRSGSTQRQQGAEATPERRRTGRNSKNANKNLLAKECVLSPGKKFRKKQTVEQDTHYRAKQHSIRSSVEMLPTTQTTQKKVGGCVTHHDHVLDLQNGFLRQKTELNKNLNEQFTLQEMKEKEINKIKSRAKSTKKEAKSMSHCVDEITKEAHLQRSEIVQMVSKTANDLNCFLSDTESDVRARYQAAKTKIYDIGQSYHWPIPQVSESARFIPFTDGPTTIDRSTSGSPATAAPTTADLTTTDLTTAERATTAPMTTTDLITAEPTYRWASCSNTLDTFQKYSVMLEISE